MIRSSPVHQQMSVPIYVGDEVNAAGFRLAGVSVRVPGREDVSELLRRACEETSLILLSADIARRIPAAERDRLLAGLTPAVVVVPDLRGGVAMPDLATRVRAQLGVLE